MQSRNVKTIKRGSDPVVKFMLNKMLIEIFSGPIITLFIRFHPERFAQQRPENEFNDK